MFSVVQEMHVMSAAVIVRQAKEKFCPEVVENHTFLCEENHVFSDPGDFPGCPPAVVAWYFRIKCEIWSKIV